MRCWQRLHPSSTTSPLAMKSIRSATALRAAITEPVLKQLAGPKAYERGRGYFQGGAVGLLVETDSAAEATVSGTHDYRARLNLAGERLESACNCPVGLDGGFCKHLVALGLACLSPDHHHDRDSPRTATLAPDALRTHIESLSREELVSLLRECADTHRPLRRRIEMEAASRRGSAVNLATFRKAIGDATHRRGGFVGYSESWSYARGIEDVIGSIGRLLPQGHATEAMELSEYALVAVEKAMGHIDDSGGVMAPLLEQLQDIHHAACIAAQPNPVKLATRLFEWELRTDWDTFHGAVERYAQVLGETGLATYRKRAEAVWSKLPKLKPGEDRAGSFTERFRITAIMEGLARESGDVDALIAVKAHDLSTPYSFLKIAELCRDAGRRDEALRWAERGLSEFAQDRPDPRVQEMVADEYHARGRHDEAMQLVWAMFVAASTLERYQTLKGHADRIHQWPVWRDKALAHLRVQSEPDAPRRAGHFARRRDRSTLVMIFLWEDDVATAWAEALAGGCTDPLWMELASLRECTHPADAIPVYQRLVETTLERKSNRAYADATGLMRRIATLMQALRQKPDFESYLASVRLAHKPKRNFMKLLDEARWW